LGPGRGIGTQFPERLSTPRREAGTFFFISPALPVPRLSRLKDSRGGFNFLVIAGFWDWGGTRDGIGGGTPASKALGGAATLFLFSRFPTQGFSRLPNVSRPYHQFVTFVT
jgi:hypothetical protein